MELNEAIEKRRSVRKFTDEHVTDEQIQEALGAARMAPSWANTQSWEFIVVRDRDRIERIADVYSETNPAKKGTKSASALIIGCAKKRLAGHKEGKYTTKHKEWFMFDLGLAVQNLCLKAHELGVGTVIVGSFDHDKCGEILGVPEDYEVVVSIPMGIPAIAAKEGPPRKELKDFVHLEEFGKSFNP